MTTKLTITDTINTVIQGEIKELIEYNGAPFIKFQLIVTAIEFLGACLDNHKFEDNEKSEIRFNKALVKLFPKPYKKYSKKDSEISLYKQLRCGMIHKLRPLSSKIRLTERRHLNKGQEVHMTEIDNDLFLVLEDFYADLYKACDELKKMDKNGKLPTKKMEQEYITVHKGSTGHTETHETKVVKE